MNVTSLTCLYGKQVCKSSNAANFPMVCIIMKKIAKTFLFTCCLPSCLHNQVQVNLRKRLIFGVSALPLHLFVLLECSKCYRMKFSLLTQPCWSMEWGFASFSGKIYCVCYAVALASVLSTSRWFWRNLDGLARLWWPLSLSYCWSSYWLPVRSVAIMVEGPLQFIVRTSFEISPFSYNLSGGV